MKKSSKKLPNELATNDAALFRAAVGEVQPLPEQNRISPKPISHKAPIYRAIQTFEIQDKLSDFVAEGSPNEFLRNGISRFTLRKIRNGTWPVQDQLDLHGNHREAARKLLQEFLHEATQQEFCCVRVIHGKGLNSKGGEAVLRNLTRHWLIQYPSLLAYCEAPPAQGGSGAVLVLLKISKID